MEVSTLASIELVLATDGTVESIDDLTTLFDLVLLVVDANNATTTSRALQVYANLDRVMGDADVNLDLVVVAASGSDAVQVAGEFSARGRVFEDPDGSVADRLGVHSAPTLLWITPASEERARLEGWQPDQWRPVIADLAAKLAWTRPLIPAPKDPAPFRAVPFLPPPDEEAETNKDDGS